MTFELVARGRRIPLADEEAEARRLFRWYLAECAVDHFRRYRLVRVAASGEEQVVELGSDLVGVVHPFYARA
jgi:hypothetical protein